MKKLTLIFAPLVIMMGLQANSKKVTQEEIESSSIKHIEIKKSEHGNTLNSYSKPGAPIDMEFNTTHIKVDEIADVNITLMTSSVNNGILDVQLSLDKNLTTIEPLDRNLTFQISPENKKFKIDFQVKSKNEGLFYIRMLTKIDNGFGPKLRSFAVPVYVGEKPKALSQTNTSKMKAFNDGENISVSKAVETIRVVEEKK